MTENQHYRALRNLENKATKTTFNVLFASQSVLALNFVVNQGLRTVENSLIQS